MTALKRLVGSTAIYAMANVINSAIPFLLLPVLTRVLAPEEYGVVAMFTTVMAVLSAFTGLSMHGAVSVRYFNSQTNHPRFLGSCLVLLSCSTSIVLAFMWVMGGIFSEWVGLPEKWLLLAVLASSFQTLIYIRLVMWQVKGQAVRYGFFQVIQTLVNLGVSLWLIIIADMGWEGRVLGIFVALSVFGVLAVFSLWLKDLMQLSFDRKYIRASLAFGVPLIPHSIGGIMMVLSDRFILTALVGISATGSYVVGAQVGMAVGLLADGFNKAFGPHLLRELQRLGGQVDVALAKQCLMVFGCFLLISLGFVLFAPLLYKFFIGSEYSSSLIVAQWVGFGNAFLGMYYVLSGFIFYSERTGLLSKLTLACGVLNVFVTYFLVVVFGSVGAAIGYCIVQFIFFCGALRLCQNVCPIPWAEAVSMLAKMRTR